MMPHGVIFNAFARLTSSLLARSVEIAYCIYGSSCCDCAEEGSDWHSFTLFTNLFLIMPLNGKGELGCAARLRYLPGATERKEKGKTLRDRRLYLLSLSRLSTSNCSPYKWCFSLSHLIVAARGGWNARSDNNMRFQLNSPMHDLCLRDCFLLQSEVLKTPTCFFLFLFFSFPPAPYASSA